MINPLGKTPEHWRHVRLDEVDEDAFAVRTFICHGQFFPGDLAALGEPRETKTEGIPLAAALALGARLESAILKMEGQPEKPRKGRK